MGNYDPLSGLFQQGRLSQQQAELAMTMAEMQQKADPRSYDPYAGYGGYSACSTVGSVPAAKFTSTPSKPKELSLFTEIGRDIQSFILEHRTTLYFLAIALIVDHVLFKDAFRHRLQSMGMVHGRHGLRRVRAALGSPRYLPVGDRWAHREPLSALR